MSVKGELPPARQQAVANPGGIVGVAIDGLLCCIGFEEYGAAYLAS